MYISRRKHKPTSDIPTVAATGDCVLACENNAEINFPDTVPLPDASDMPNEESIFPSDEENGEPLEVERELYIAEGQRRETQNDDIVYARDEIPEEDNDIAVPSNPQDLDGKDEWEDVLTYDEFIVQNTASGVLRIQASAGGQSIPLGNVRVSVYKDLADGRHIFYTVTTNSDGVADGMVLPAPPRENSIIGNGMAPFANYSVIAERDGMRGETVENVPIFAGVKSIQPITLASLPMEV